MDECKPLRGGGAAQAVGAVGRAVQVDPVKPTLKAPGTKRLKLKYVTSLSNFAFKFKLRRYSWDPNADGFIERHEMVRTGGLLEYMWRNFECTVGRCRLTLSKTRVESAYGVNA